MHIKPEHLSAIKRIANTEDGKEFIEILKIMSLQNYNTFKRVPNNMSDICKGRALAIDELIDLFEAHLGMDGKQVTQPIADTLFP